MIGGESPLPGQKIGDSHPKVGSTMGTFEPLASQARIGSSAESKERLILSNWLNVWSGVPIFGQ